MIVLDVQQGSAQWRAARMGIPTASNFKRILTASGKLSNASAGYMDELLYEWRIGKIPMIEKTGWMRRGIELEPEARLYYASTTGAEVAQVGLVYRDQRQLIAASPDGLVGENGLLEIKCPKLSTHMAYLRDGKVPPAYIPQMQGQMWVTNREWCDFFSYHPDILGPDVPGQFLVRIDRDEAYIQKLGAAVDDFVSTMMDKRKRVSPMLERLATIRSLKPLSK